MENVSGYCLTLYLYNFLVAMEARLCGMVQANASLYRVGSRPG